MSQVQDALHRAVAGKSLGEDQAYDAMLEILRGDATPVLIAALLTALRMKGETTAEVTGFARAMRASAVRVRSRATPAAELVDTCGTGGDGGATFNISTAAAFVAAGAGLRIAKHGNRSVSSRCGSADVLEACGVNVNLTAEQVAEAIDAVGIGFLFAPHMHPAMRHAGPVRRELGLRTVFNMLGPLTNPAGAALQVMGVFESQLVPLAAEALRSLGARRALVVHGSDGMDEITLTGATRFAELRDGAIRLGVLEPGDFGLPRAGLETLAGGDRETNREILRAVLAGETGPARDIVLANAAAAIRVAGRVEDWREGVARAAESIASGAAAAKLAALAEFSQRSAPDA